MLRLLKVSVPVPLSFLMVMQLYYLNRVRVPPQLSGFVLPPGFDSQTHHLCFYQFLLIYVMWKRRKNKGKTGWDWPIFYFFKNLFKKTFLEERQLTALPGSPNCSLNIIQVEQKYLQIKMLPACGRDPTFHLLFHFFQGSVTVITITIISGPFEHKKTTTTTTTTSSTTLPSF